MKLFSNHFCRAGGHVLFLPLLLLAFALSIAAQEVGSQSPRDDHSVSNRASPRVATPVLVITDHLSQPEDSIGVGGLRRFVRPEWSTDPAHRATPGQGSTNSTYVFPTRSERFKRYLWDTFGLWTLVGIAGAAGIDQWEDNPPEWGQGASGYGKRYASNFGQNAIQQTVSYGLSEAFRLDTGFRKSTRHGFGPRLEDALIQNVTSRTRSGKRVVSVPRLSGFYVGGIVPAVTWYPSRFGVKDGLREGSYALAGGFVINVIREFIFHR